MRTIKRMFQVKLSEKQVRQWSVQREVGKTRWILGWGVMYFGGATFTWNTALKLFIFGNEVVKRSDIVFDLITLHIFGFLYGLWSWNATEKAYRDYQIRNEAAVKQQQ